MGRGLTEGILAFAERIPPRASDLWVQASLDDKQRLQQSVLAGRNRVRRKSIQSNRRNGTTFQLLGANVRQACINRQWSTRHLGIIAGTLGAEGPL